MNMNMNSIVSLFAVVAVALALPASARDCVITEFGAKANDETVDTVAIQQAIDACAAAGGGRVVIPNGIFVSGTVSLKSNIELYLAHGATLKGSPMVSDYAASKESDGNHVGGKRDGLIVAEKAHNVAITGFGTIDGNGEAFWDPGFLTSGKSRPSLPRPMPWIEFRDSKNITVRDTTFVNSPSYGVTLSRSTDIDIYNIRILADPRSPNSDGIQVNDSKRVTIRAVHIATGDDNIVLKSESGDVEDVVVSDSILTSDDTAFKLGTGSAKGVRRITLRDTTMINSRIGIGFFMRRGGVYEDIEIRNVRFLGRSRSTMEWPIYLDIDRRSEGNTLGAIRDIRIDGMRIESRGNILITGNPAAPIENLTLRDIVLSVSEAASLVSVNKPRGNVTAGVIPGSVDYSTENSHITVGHVRNLVATGLRVVGDEQSVVTRRALSLIGVSNARFEYLDSSFKARAKPPIALRDSIDVLFAAGRIGTKALSRGDFSLEGRVERTTLCAKAVSDCALMPLTVTKK